MRFFRRLRTLMRRGKIDAEMTEELRAHLELQTEENRRRGLPPEEARHAALREFGGVEQIKERAREQRGGLWLEQAIKDLRHAARLLRRAPAFACTAIVSLALGIGASVAMLSLVDHALLRPLPYPEPERLVALWSESRRGGVAAQSSSHANIADWRAGARSFSEIAAYDPVSLVVNTGKLRRASGVLASAQLSRVLGVTPLLGRWFTEDEATRRQPVVLVARTTWERDYGGVTDILGRRVEIDGRAFEIVGVVPDGFPARDTEFWLPDTFGLPQTGPLGRGLGSWLALGRLAPSATLAEAQVEVSSVAARLARDFAPANAGLEVRLVPLQDQVVGADLRHALLLLLAAVGGVLLIACSNVGNLLLARGLARQRELAMRSALGASRRRLAVQLLIENLLLCVIAAFFGAALAWAILAGVRGFGPPGLPRLEELALNWRMLVAVVGFAWMGVGSLGLLPVFQSGRRDPLATARESGRGASEGPRTRRLRSALVVGQFALAVMLFTGAMLLVRSFAKLLAVDPGFNADNVLLVSIRLGSDRPLTDAPKHAEAVIERVAALPGVVAAAVSEEVLLGERGALGLVVENVSPETGGVVRLTLGSDAVSTEYFRTLGVILREGREFTAQDSAQAPPVAIVSETLARHLWPDGKALGRRLRLAGGDPNAPPPWATVIGVAADQRRQKLERAPIPQIFWPLAQQPSRAMNLIVRTESDPATLSAAVRQTLREVDATVPVAMTTTLAQQLGRTLAPRKFQLGLLSAFAATALVLAGVGILGLMHYAVTRREKELGVRAALGATAGRILRQVLGEGLVLATLGVALGLVGTFALARGFAALVYDVSPTDVWSMVAAAATLTAVAALACFLPAWRASRIDPMAALRAE